MSFVRVRQHKLLSALGAIILLLLIAIVGVIVFSEPLTRWVIEDKGSKATGRPLTIDGPLVIDWHWTYTSIHAKNIRLGNAAGYREPDMVSVDTLEFTLKPLKLFWGKLELGSVTLEKPVVILERKTFEDANWNFPSLSGDKEKNSEDNVSDKLQINDRLAIRQGRIIFRDAVRNLSLDLKVDSIGDTPKQEKEYEFKLSGTGKLQGRPLSLDAVAGSLQSLRDPATDFPLHFKINMGKTRVEMNGVFNDPFNFSGVNVNLKIVGDNLADLFYLTAIPLPPTPPYRLNGQLTKNGDVWGYSDFTGEVGKSDLSGSLSYDVGGPRGFLKATLFSNVLDSADLGGFIGLPPSLDAENTTNEQQQAAAAKKESAKLIPDVPLNVERLRTTDLDVTLTAKEINAPNLPFKGMEVRFLLKDGQLTLDPFSVVLADGTVDGVIKVDARQDIPPMDMKLNFRKLSLNKFFENTRFATTTQGFFGGNLTLAGTGASLADVLGSSSGKTAIIISGGQISLLLIEASDVDLGEAIPLFLGKDKATKIRCGVADFDVKDGQLTSKTFVLDTNDSTLVGRIGIDLKQEKIDARLDAKPKDNSVLSARIPITLSGNLKSPRIGLDAEKTGARGAAAIALGTLLTPFAALLAFIDSGDAKDTDCHALISAAK
ncbi:MAG: hypothetical protein B0W54_00340 [Cellvibrio sp. 79]|nr:MAG: hypothetical protein B0W54_00340 [Cellvibrio sp. 79]